MKEFRMTIVATMLLLVLGGLYWYRQQIKNIPEDKQLFDFEKHQLHAVNIHRPGQPLLRLEEKDGKWWIVGSNHEASVTMVNRIKHQLHDLEARAKVTDDAEDFTVYGLGDKAILVELELATGEKTSFQAGDPNPTGVSYYIRPLPGNAVYIVKKSALDYYSADYDSFRENAFFRFTLPSVNSIEIHNVAQNSTWKLEKHQEEGAQNIHNTTWFVTHPIEIEASLDVVKRILGRLLALKASRFIGIAEQQELEAKGIACREPLYSVSIVENTTKRTLYIGPVQDAEAYMWVESPTGEKEIVLAKSGVIDDVQLDQESIRNRNVFRSYTDDIQSIQIASTKQGAQMSVSLSMESGRWYWGQQEKISDTSVDTLLSSIKQLQVFRFVEDASTQQKIQQAPMFSTLELQLSTSVIEISLRDIDVQGLIEDIPSNPEPEKETKLYAAEVSVHSDINSAIASKAKEYYIVPSYLVESMQAVLVAYQQRTP